MLKPSLPGRLQMQFHMSRRVEFGDTDMAGIAHFTSILRYMEEAEHGLLRECGLSVVMQDEKGKLGFPKLNVRCVYHHPARYEQLLEVGVTADCQQGKSVRYHCRVTHAGQPVAEGQIEVAFCRFPADGSAPYAIPLPDHVLRRFGAALPGDGG
jgi:YbgC/YbaW family acyl-CoA thioester hydrolase